jgi:hypothetical protein
MSFLNPFYQVVFGYLPDFMQIFGGTLLMWSLAIIISIVPTYGHHLKLGFIVLIIANSAMTIIELFAGGDGGFQSMFETGIANITVLLIMLLGLIYFKKLKSTKIGFLIGYYGYWLAFFVIFLIITTVPDYAINGMDWMTTGWIASVLILSVTCVNLYNRREPEYIMRYSN